MTIPAFALAFCAFTTAAHLVSVAVAAWRCRARKTLVPPPAHAPGVSIVRPLCGIENHLENTLRSSFTLDYPDTELIFSVAQASDPVIGLVHRLMREHPQVRARLIVGDERISSNPKLNNMVKGLAAAAHEWVIFADSNVLMPRDYVQRLLAAWRDDTGLVCSPPSGSAPQSFWAELECAFLNTHQARWQYAADTVGLGFAQGKTMLWRRDLLDAAGGIRALAAEPAEDAASTKVVRAAGLRVRLAGAPFSQPLGHRRFADVWTRQARWARLRRASFPLFFAPELMVGALLPIAAAGYAAGEFGVPVLAAMATLALIWYGAEWLLAAAAGWPRSWRFLPVSMLRDLLLPVLWFDAWRGDRFVWRGNAMSVADGELGLAAASGE